MVILFDLDGTLIDSTEAIVESFYVGCDKFSFKRPDKENIVSLIGYPLDIMYEKSGVEKDRVWDFVDAYKEHYRKISKQKTFMLPCAKDAVLEAKKFATLGVVTTKTSRYSKELLGYFEILHYFDVLIGREDVKNPKPHAEPILKALAYMNKTKENSFMIGDTHLDMLCAKNAGIKCVGVTTGYDTKDTLMLYTDNIKDSLKEAVEYILAI